MPYSVVIPRLGLTMEAARVVQWYKQAGEAVSRGELLFSVESDKAVQDIEALASGVVYPLPNLPDEALPIGTPIGYILAPGEAVPAEVAAAAPAAAAPSVAPAAVAAAPQASPEASESSARKLSSPAARRRAKELGFDWRSLERPGGGPILLATVEQAAQRVAQSAPAPVGANTPVAANKPVAAKTPVAAAAAVRVGAMNEWLSVEADAEALAALLTKLGTALSARKQPAPGWPAWFARIAAAAAAASEETRALAAAPGRLGVYVDERADVLGLTPDEGQAALLAAGRIRACQGARVTLSLSYDRAQVTREVAGRLLDAVRALVEQPWLLLAS